MKPPRILTVAEDYAGLVEGLIARRLSMGLTQEEVNARAGLADRYVSKVEISHHVPTARSARALGALSLPCLLGALNLRLALVPDDVCVLPKLSRHERARRGGRGRAERLSPEQRRESARRAARARWDRARS